MKTIVWVVFSSRVNNEKKNYIPVAKLYLMPTGAEFEVTTVEKTKNYAVFAVVQNNNSSVTGYK